MLEPEQIEHWFLQYGDDIHQYLSYFTGSLDVEDLVQETFIRAWKGLAGYKKRSGPRTWLYAIARNVALDSMRRSQRELKTSQHNYEDIASPYETPEDIVAMRDARDRILQVLDAMRPSYREVILCRTIMAMSIVETAEVLGWTKTRVNVTLHRAIKALRMELQSGKGGVMYDLAERG